MVCNQFCCRPPYRASHGPTAHDCRLKSRSQTGPVKLPSHCAPRSDDVPSGKTPISAISQSIAHLLRVLTEDGRRKTEDGRRKTENGKRKTENGKRKTENGKRSSVL